MAYIFFEPQEPRKLISLVEMARELEASPYTLRMWARDGIKGEQLRVCQSPRALSSTWDEYDDFIRRLSREEERRRNGDLKNRTAATQG
jgi:hypothetical protein